MSNEATTDSPGPGPVPAEAPGPSDATTPLPPPPQGPLPQAAFAYPSDPHATEPARPSWGKRTVLFVVGAVVVAALLFGGGFWAGSAVNSIPGISDGRFGDDHRMGPGGPGDPRGHGRENEGTDGDGSTDTSNVVG